MSALTFKFECAPDYHYLWVTLNLYSLNEWSLCFAQIIGVHSWVTLKGVALLSWLMGCCLTWKYLCQLVWNDTPLVSLFMSWIHGRTIKLHCTELLLHWPFIWYFNRYQLLSYHWWVTKPNWLWGMLFSRSHLLLGTPYINASKKIELAWYLCL